NRTQTRSDGTVVDETFASHPEFNTAAPVLTSRTTTLPSGMGLEETHSLSRAGDVWTEIFGLNGSIAVTQTDQAQNTVTSTSAEGRTVVTMLDDLSRPVQVQVGDLAPTQFVYNSQGRLIATTTDDGASTRTTTLDYFSDN